MAITQRNLMFFDTDEEFADFVFQPYAVFSENNGQLSYDAAYRVFVPEDLGSSRKDVCVSLPVDNLSDGFIDL